MATILVCDDHATVRALVRCALEYDGHSVVEAQDGAEAFALAGQSPPDLVITDLVMPRQSGIDLLEKLNGSPALDCVPTLLMTASPLVDAETAVVGADAYLAKPFETTALIKTVRRLLTRAE